MRYSIELRERIHVKGYGFLSFARNLGKHSIKVAKNLNNKYGKKLADSAKKSATDALKIAGKRAIQKTVEATGDLIGTKIAYKITSYSKKPANEPHSIFNILIFKNCAPFTNCKSQINNTDLDNAKYQDIVMPMYNLIEYSDNYSKTSESLWQYCKDIPAINNNNAIVDFTNDNLADSFNFKVKMIGQTRNNETKNAEIMVPLKYLSNFWRTLEMPLINCEITLLLTWSASCVIVSTAVANQNARLEITDTKLLCPSSNFITAR